MLDSVSQALIMDNLLEEFSGRGLVWVLHKAELARSFDYVLVMRSGKIIEQGTFDELNSEGTYLKKLLDGA